MVRRCSQRQLEALRRGREKLRHKRTKKTTNYEIGDGLRALHRIGRKKPKYNVKPNPQIIAALSR